VAIFGDFPNLKYFLISIFVTEYSYFSIFFEMAKKITEPHWQAEGIIHNRN
jgi:hypothetical protein